MYWGLAVSVGTQNQKGYRWYKWALGAPRSVVGLMGHWGHKGGVLCLWDVTCV